jgi:hypothetical protein
MTQQLRTLAQALLNALEAEAKAQSNWENARSNYTGSVDSYEDDYYRAVIATATATSNLRHYLKENPTCPACCPPNV